MTKEIKTWKAEMSAQKYYKVVMSKGDPVYLSEEKIKKLDQVDGQIIHTKDYKNNDVFINKAHIVQMVFDPTAKKKVHDSEVKERMEATKRRFNGHNS